MEDHKVTPEPQPAAQATATYTITEAAKVLGITRQGVYGKLAWGRMKAWKNRFDIWEIPVSEVEKVISARALQKDNPAT